MKYDLDYYIERFSAIPDDQWITGEFKDNQGRCCALGHLGERNMGDSPQDVLTLQYIALDNGNHYISNINDGEPEYLHLGNTPKERVINFLKQLKDGTNK